MSAPAMPIRMVRSADSVRGGMGGLVSRGEGERSTVNQQERLGGRRAVPGREETEILKQLEIRLRRRGRVTEERRRVIHGADGRPQPEQLERVDAPVRGHLRRAQDTLTGASDLLWRRVRGPLREGLRRFAGEILRSRQVARERTPEGIVTLLDSLYFCGAIGIILDRLGVAWHAPRD